MEKSKAKRNFKTLFPHSLHTTNRFPMHDPCQYLFMHLLCHCQIKVSCKKYSPGDIEWSLFIMSRTQLSNVANTVKIHLLVAGSSLFSLSVKKRKHTLSLLKAQIFISSLRFFGLQKLTPISHRVTESFKNPNYL